MAKCTMTLIVQLGYILLDAYRSLWVGNMYYYTTLLRNSAIKIISVMAPLVEIRYMYTNRDQTIRFDNIFF
jgi:hypothetical protein